jgi:hypothetical protein
MPMWHLFGLFWPLAIAQSHTWAAAVLVDEFDTGCFECTPEDIQSRTP